MIAAVVHVVSVAAVGVVVVVGAFVEVAVD